MNTIPREIVIEVWERQCALGESENLGIALAGQGQYREAAQAFVNATRVNAADNRAFYLLKDLLKQHPELEYEFQETLEFCQKAVEVAAKKAAEMKPVVHRGWRKQLILLKARLHSLFQRRAR